MQSFRLSQESERGDGGRVESIKISIFILSEMIFKVAKLRTCLKVESSPKGKS